MERCVDRSSTARLALGHGDIAFDANPERDWYVTADTLHDVDRRGELVSDESQSENTANVEKLDNSDVAGTTAGLLNLDEDALREAEALLDEDANLVEIEPDKPATGVWAAALGVSKVIDSVSGFFGKISQALVFVVFIVGVLNVVLRYVGRAIGEQLSSNLWIEGQWYLFALIALLGLAVGVRDGVNPRVDFWYADFPVKRKALVDLVFHWGLLAFSVVALRVSWPFVERSFSSREGSPDPNGIARWPLKAVLILAFSLLLAQVVSEIIKSSLTVAGRSGRLERSTPYRVE